ncbi:hypothetical protein KSP40_PGU021794 [Platanthera guangdongensis]|uniref:Uncharacterized protein n=1 Tax=Platanthera guangdongensis TaxID=2320717 RepID=A0ABR2MHZ7_9ASPA
MGTQLQLRRKTVLVSPKLLQIGPKLSQLPLACRLRAKRYKQSDFSYSQPILPYQDFH